MHPTLQLFAFLLSLSSLLLTGYYVFRREVREDGQNTAQRLKKLETGQGAHMLELASHEVRHTGHSQALSTMADTLVRDLAAKLEKDRAETDKHLAEAAAERQRILEGFDRRCMALEKEVEKIPQIRETMARMESELQLLVKIEDKLDRLMEVLTTKNLHK